MPLIIHLSEIDSTNNYLKNLALDNQLEDATVVYTSYQTAGRGQRGNSWESEDGQNLLFSLILYPTMIRANEQFIISQIISLAIKESLDKYTENISIKWPNDIYWKDQKICGILIENALLGENISHSILGVGLNINQLEFRSDAPNPTSLHGITGDIYDLKTILSEIIDKTQLYYSLLKNGEKDTIINKYKSALYRKDGFYSYSDEHDMFMAQIVDIEPSGLLVLLTDKGEVRKYAFKEVKYIL